MDWVSQHLIYSATTDACFLTDWNRMSTDERCRLCSNLRLLDRRRRELARAGVDSLAMHMETATKTQDWFRDIPEVETHRTCQPLVLIELAGNRKVKTLVHNRARVALARLRELSPVPVLRFYGGIKDDHSIQSKINSYHEGATLDLDDLIRFRFVLANLSDMLIFSRLFAAEFEPLRCRDYYSRPRNGSADPYRGLHFLITGWKGSIVEVQVLTALREAVGIIDHSIVLKKRIGYISRRHHKWLTDLSLIANIVDFDLMELGRTESSSSDCVTLSGIHVMQPPGKALAAMSC